MTLTLPEETIDKLAWLHADRATAIVRATEFAVGGANARPNVEVLSVAPGIGMLTVPECRHLQSLPGISLAQIVPGRHLIILSAGSKVADAEVGVLDLLDRLGDSDPEDRAILQQLLAYLRQFRRSDRMNLAEVILVETA